MKMGSRVKKLLDVREKFRPSAGGSAADAGAKGESSD